MKTTKYICTIALVLCMLLPTQAQNNNPNLERELSLEKEYNPSVREADKINQLPEIREPEAPKTQVEFANYTLNYQIPPYISNLQAQSYFSNFATSNKRGYLNVGVSSLIDINGDLGYQIVNSEKDFLSIFASHRSTNSDVTSLQTDDKLRMKINDNVGGLNYIHRFDKAKFFADAQYTYSAFNYYGFLLSLHYPFELFDLSTNQVNNLFKTRLGVESVNSEEINYKVNLAYSLFDQKHSIDPAWSGRTENRIMADLNFHAKFTSTAGVGLGGSMINYSYPTSPSFKVYNDIDPDRLYTMDDDNYTTLSLNPYFTFEGDDWDVRLGASGNMRVGGIKDFLLAPDIKFNWRPTEQFLLYILATGGIKDNSSYNMFYENRYIDPLYRVEDSKSPVDGTFGLNFLVLPNLEMGVFTGYKLTKNEHFYAHIVMNPQTGSLMAQRIIPEYAKAETFKLGGSLKYAYQDIFNIGLNLSYYNWQVKESDLYLQAWGKPSFVGDIHIGLKTPDFPLRMDLAYRLEAGRKTLPPSISPFVDLNMKNINDLNLKVSYDINNSFTVFAQANNLLFQKYDLWYGYPAQDFNIMGGISVKF